MNVCFPGNTVALEIFNNHLLTTPTNLRQSSFNNCLRRRLRSFRWGRRIDRSPRLLDYQSFDGRFNGTGRLIRVRHVWSFRRGHVLDQLCHEIRSLGGRGIRSGSRSMRWGVAVAPCLSQWRRHGWRCWFGRKSGCTKARNCSAIGLG